MNNLGLSCLIRCIIPPTVNATPNQVVGGFSDQNHVKIEGVMSFDTAQVKHALMTDLEVIMTASPSSSRSAYIDTLKTRLRDGFMRVGLVECGVTAQPDYALDFDTVHLTIHRANV